MMDTLMIVSLTLVILSIFVVLCCELTWLKMGRNADWKGKLEQRFVFYKLKYEYGRFCYTTTCTGDTRGVWWEKERE